MESENVFPVITLDLLAMMVSFDQASEITAKAVCQGNCSCKRVASQYSTPGKVRGLGTIGSQ